MVTTKNRLSVPPPLTRPLNGTSGSRWQTVFVLPLRTRTPSTKKDPAETGPEVGGAAVGDGVVRGVGAGRGVDGEVGRRVGGDVVGVVAPGDGGGVSVRLWVGVGPGDGGAVVVSSGAVGVGNAVRVTVGLAIAGATYGSISGAIRTVARPCRTAGVSDLLCK